MNKLKQIQISEEVWKKARIYCAEQGVTLKQFIEKLINNGTAKNMSSM